VNGLIASGWSWVGAGLGLVWALGAALVVVRLPRNREPGLAERVGPYVSDTARVSALLARTEPGAVTVGLGRILAPVLRDLGRWVERVLGGAASVRRRLERAGLPADVERFRAEQVVWGALGGVAGIVVGSFGALARGASPLQVVLLVVILAATGVVLRDQYLTRQAVRREHRMLTEFPTVAELLALAVGAGEGAVGALERVVRLSRGELSNELRRALSDARAGASLPVALQGVADRTGLVSLARFVDGIIVAVERGTPLGDVLRAQAQDVREIGRRTIMEEGGKKEIAMMVPVVFFVLPVTIVFALFPGLSLLSLSV
jgi:tight adherence protein C